MTGYDTLSVVKELRAHSNITVTLTRNKKLPQNFIYCLF